MRFTKLFAAVLCSLAALAASGQNLRDEIAANPGKSGGVYYVYTYDNPVLTPAPKGYKPFYISHYGRHGSRWLLHDSEYDEVMAVFRAADAANAFTERGREVYGRVKRVYDDGIDRGGDLSPLGAEQHREIAALLCGTAFAAYTNGWFGFDRLFGEKTALIEEHIASYDETTDVDITQPTYTEEEQAMIDEGTMQVPDIADLSDTGVSAETDDFTFTLESMLVSRNSLYAILRIDAKNDDAAAELAAIPETDGYQKELKRMLWVGAHNNTNFGGFGADHRLEWKNGGMSMEIMQVEGSTAYALLTNIGGEFEPGDRILFDMSHHDQNVDLFEIPVPAQLEQELVIELDGESGPDDRYCWQTATISPISFQLDGIYGSGETSNEAVSITLKDGTSFALSSAENGHEDSLYGTYGSWGSSYAGSWESGDVKETWLFSQLIDLADLASITVDGVTYPVG